MDDDPEKEMRLEIITTNLLNGLYLTEEQMRVVFEEAKRVELVRSKLRDEVEDISESEREAMRILREEVKTEVPDISKDVARRIHERSERMLERRKEYVDIIEEAARIVKDELTENQLYAIKNFKPCLVPPKGPARIGQAQGGERGVKMLERIRNAPQAKYEAKKDQIVDRHLERISLKHPEFREEELNGLREEFIAIIEEVRSLSDTEFALKKQAKALQIKQMAEDEKEVSVDRRIVRFLLNPQIVPILEEKLQETSY